MKKYDLLSEIRRRRKWQQLHSDQGFQYTSQAYFQLTKQYGITPCMSRKGNPYDNAMEENFCSILKTECIYRHKPVTFSEANEMIDRYIYFYNHERIQLNTADATPLQLKLNFSYQGLFLCCPHNLGQLKWRGRSFFLRMLATLFIVVK